MFGCGCPGDVIFESSVWVFVDGGVRVVVGRTGNSGNFVVVVLVVGKIMTMAFPSGVVVGLGRLALPLRFRCF